MSTLLPQIVSIVRLSESICLGDVSHIPILYILPIHISFISITRSYSIMAQLGLARFRGDTTFGFVARIGSTFLGGVLGMVIWYVFLTLQSPHVC